MINTATPSQPTRFWELDVLRGLTVIIMIFYHSVWDVAFFNLYPVNVLSSGWQTFARGIATSFTFILGISLTLSYQRAVRHTGQTSLFPKYLQRGLMIFGLGMVITVATYFFIGANGFVIFGILHLLGLSVILSYPFLKLNRWLNLTAGLSVIAIGLYLDTLTSTSPWWIWLGIKQFGRSMVDYYPLFPWWGLALLGIFAGKTLYPAGQPRHHLPDLTSYQPIRALRVLGQHSLLIYMIHQPILISLFMLIQLTM